ncbi:MAG: lysylphosphatidylglycerol synthase domain-containing protein [Acidobacteriota bacterium]|jgi:uncharacterized membrane protein YbhN (UPF0104 family)
MKKRTRRVLATFFGLILFGVAVFVLYHDIRNYNFHKVLAYIQGFPIHRLILAFVFMVLDYWVLTGYDTLAVHYIGRKLKYRRVAFASFIGYAFSHNMGTPALSGGAARLRVYKSWGLSTMEITQIVAFCTLTFYLGFFAMGGTVFLFEPLPLPKDLRLPWVTVRPLGIIFLFLLAAVTVAVFILRRPIHIYKWTIPRLSPRVFGLQLLVALGDWLLASSVLYALLPPSKHIAYYNFLGVFLLAQITGLASQVPGGLGVFETVIWFLLKSSFPPSALLTSLLVFRGIYYLVPFFAGAIMLGVHELTAKRRRRKRRALPSGGKPRDGGRAG